MDMVRRKCTLSYIWDRILWVKMSSIGDIWDTMSYEKYEHTHRTVWNVCVWREIENTTLYAFGTVFLLKLWTVHANKSLITVVFLELSHFERTATILYLQTTTIPSKLLFAKVLNYLRTQFCQKSQFRTVLSLETCTVYPIKNGWNYNFDWLLNKHVCHRVIDKFYCYCSTRLVLLVLRLVSC